MRALVTGATGVVGANLVRGLLGAGDQVRALVRAKSDRRAIAGLALEVAVGDLLDPGSLDGAVAGCDVVYHAGSVFQYWGISEAALAEVSLTGVRNLLAACARAGVGRVVLTSSSVTLGSSTGTIPLDEAHPGDEPRPPPYFRAKIEQERLAFTLAAAAGIELVAACPSLVVGPHDHRLGPSNAALVTYLRDPWRTTFAGGCNLVHAADVAAGHRLLALHGKAGERYCLGADNHEWSLVHRMLSELCGLPPPRLHATRTAAYLAALVQEATALLGAGAPRTTRAQANMVGRFYWYRSDKAAALGYRARPTRQALAETLAWLIVGSTHISPRLRASLRLSAEVARAREEFLTPAARPNGHARLSPASLQDWPRQDGHRQD